MKVKCLIDGKEVECKVVENIGYREGFFIKIVEIGDKEITVQKPPNSQIYVPRTIRDRTI